MAKAINWNNFSQGFGESFNQTITELRRLREQREQFDQEMGFRERQMLLEDKRRQQYYDISQQQEDRLTETTKADFQKDYIPLSGEFDLNSGFKAFQQAPPESIQSSQDIQEGFPILGEGLKQGLYANRNLIPETPKAEPLFDITETFPNEQGVPTVYGISKTTLDKYPLGVDYDEQTQRINANKTNKEEPPTLLKDKFERDALARLTDPQAAQAPPEGVDPGLWALMGGGKQYPVEHDFTIVATGLLKDSDMLNKLQALIQQEGGYPSPQRLVEKLEPLLSDDQLGKLDNFLNFYDQFEKNLPKPLDRNLPKNRPMKTY